jgi:hypothetical protein
VSQNIGNDGPPPIPAGGLPPGWDLEQWNHYGQQWLIQNPQTTAPTVPVNNYPTVSATPPTAPTPPTPSNQDMIQQPTPPVVVQPPVMMVPHYKTNSNPGKIIGIIAIVGVLVVVMIIVLSGVLYVWANSLDPSSADEIEGTWYNPVDTMTFYPNGTASESTGIITQWRTNGSDLYTLFELGEDDIDVRWIYEIKTDNQGDLLLVMALYQIETEDLNQTNEVDEESCIMYSNSVQGAENDYFEGKRAIFPSWCNPDHDI